jgi:hypothetical protein
MSLACTDVAHLCLLCLPLLCSCTCCSTASWTACWRREAPTGRSTWICSQTSLKRNSASLVEPLLNLVCIYIYHFRCICIALSYRAALKHILTLSVTAMLNSFVWLFATPTERTCTLRKPSKVAPFSESAMPRLRCSTLLIWH